MAMERVTVEQNGERFELEVPEGTSDADIEKYISSQQAPTQNPMLQAEPKPVEYAGPSAVGATARLAQQYAPNSVIGDAYNIAKILNNNLTLEHVSDFIKKPVTNTLNAAGAYLGGLPFAKMTPAQAIPAAGRAIGSAVLGPESAVMMPYQMAAYEQDKIRANPNAPGLEYNPYAQVQRGEAPTTRAAGAANQRLAVANQRYGGLSAQEQAILDKDRLNMAVRMQAAKRILGQ